jgi:predicted HicB family RNase H-like nuclease
MKKTYWLQIRVTEEEHRHYHALAKQQDVTITQVVRKAMQRWAARMAKKDKA